MVNQSEPQKLRNEPLVVVHNEPESEPTSVRVPNSEKLTKCHDGIALLYNVRVFEESLCKTE